MFLVPPEGAADMIVFRSILDGIREAGLWLTGSPHSRIRQRAALRNLDAHLLRDIGLTAEAARRGGAPDAGAAPESPRPAGSLTARRAYPIDSPRES
jgi:uncharacterized protein YjiS (DUF1127 family)